MSLAKHCAHVKPVASATEVSGYLVGSTAFKAAGTSDPRPAGSIPVHLRQTTARVSVASAPSQHIGHEIKWQTIGRTSFPLTPIGARYDPHNLEAVAIGV